MKKWYTTVEVAQLLGRSDRYVRDRVKMGRMDASTGGGGVRVSYKISAEAVLTYLMAGERKSVEEVAKLLKNVDEGYLRELQGVVDSEIQTRGGGRRIQIIGKCPQMLGPLMQLEARNLPRELVLGRRDYQSYYNNPRLYWSIAVNPVDGRAEGLLSIQITTAEHLKSLCEGQAKGDYQLPWYPGEIPVVYLDSLVLEDPAWAPFLFKHMAVQLKRMFKLAGIRPEMAYAIATSRSVQQMLERHGYIDIGYKVGVHPIMLNKNIYKGRIGRYLER